MRKIFNTPEITLVVLGIFWITEKYISTGRMGYITLLVTWLLFLQIFYKNRIAGLLYGSALSMICCYKLYTTYIHADEVVTSHTLKVAVVFGLALIMSVRMLYKYAKAKESYGENVLTITY